MPEDGFSLFNCDVVEVEFAFGLVPVAVGAGVDVVWAGEDPDAGLRLGVDMFQYRLSLLGMV